VFQRQNIQLPQDTLSTDLFILIEPNEPLFSFNTLPKFSAPTEKVEVLGGSSSVTRGFEEIL
jgi:hypothetical protein